MTIIIFGAIVLLGILLLYIYYRQRHHADAEPENDESKAYAIFTQALDQMGCQYTSHSPNNIEFPYQGFRMLCNYRAIDVLLAIPFIYELELDDFDNVAIAQEIANEVNCMKNVSIGYSINKEKGQMYVHVLSSCWIFGDIDTPTDYVKWVLDMMVDAQRDFIYLMNQRKQ